MDSDSQQQPPHSQRALEQLARQVLALPALLVQPGQLALLQAALVLRAQALAWAWFRAALQDSWALLPRQPLQASDLAPRRLHLASVSHRSPRAD